MDPELPDSLHFSAVDQRIAHLNAISAQMQSFLEQTRLASIPTSIYEGVYQIQHNLDKIRQSARRLEGERKGILALVQISQYINSSLDLDEVLLIAIDIIIRLTRAERGFLMLAGEDGQLSIRVARNWEQESIDRDEWAISHTVINRVVSTGEPVLTTDAQEDPRFYSRDSIAVHQLRSILCVPIKLKGELIGVIYTDHRVHRGLFTIRERDLLLDFAHQAAVAIDNARLFASVRQTLSEVTQLKNLTDNVFTSITSGVLTIDHQENIVLMNRAAQEILGLDGSQVTGCTLDHVLPALSNVLKPYIEMVRQTEQPVLGLETQQEIVARGQLDLRLNLSPLKDSQLQTQGIAVVIEDLTEIRQLEAQRRLFARMVSPAVIEHLDPDRLQLGGQRSEITLLFSDLRGFTHLSEMIEPEELVSVLNQYLAAAAESVMNQDGTVDKFLGDAVMAWFNAPLAQVDHTLRAVRAAIAIRAVVGRLHPRLPDIYRLSFGTGIHTGEAILGLIGTEKRSDYTAIGDCVNSCRRIQESAAPGQILISEQAYQLVSNRITVKAVDPVFAKGKREPLTVFEVIDLLD
jgi:adenylate cyclase